MFKPVAIVQRGSLQAGDVEKLEAAGYLVVQPTHKDHVEILFPPVGEVPQSLGVTATPAVS